VQNKERKDLIHRKCILQKIILFFFAVFALFNYSLCKEEENCNSSKELFNISSDLISKLFLTYKNIIFPCPSLSVYIFSVYFIPIFLNEQLFISFTKVMYKNTSDAHYHKLVEQVLQLISIQSYVLKCYLN
jgi:hypothetical protein